MSYQNPVGQPEDPYERYRTERIEADKRTRDEPRKEDEESAALGAYLLLLFHRFLDFFQSKGDLGMSASIRKEIAKHLISLRETFETLKKEDRSQDAAFLALLSKQWHHLLEDHPHFRRDTPAARQFKSFIKEVDSHPKGEEFTFGYYLTEYAGQQWLPFPYMELIKKLHSEHGKAPQSSALDHWTRLIADLIRTISP